MTKETVAAMFEKAAFVNDVGIEVVHVDSERVETTLLVEPRHMQQHGVVHAGVLATLADHTAGAAGALHLDGDHSVVSIEFKINLLRPAVAHRLRCVGTPLKCGRTVIVAEADIFAQLAREGGSVDDGPYDEKLVAKLLVTLAVTERPLR